MKFRHFAKRNLQLSVVLMIMLAILSAFPFFDKYWLPAWSAFGFFSLFTFVSGYYICRSVGKPVFMGVFFGFFVIRLFVGIGFFVAINHFFHPNVMAAAISFLIIYLIFKVFETLITLKYVREEEDEAQAKANMAQH